MRDVKTSSIKCTKWLLNEESAKNNVIFKIRSTYEHSLTHSRFIDMILWYFHTMQLWQINCCWPSTQFTEFSCIGFFTRFFQNQVVKHRRHVQVPWLASLVMHTWTLCDMWWYCVKNWCVNSQLYTLWMKPLDTCGLVCVVVILGSNLRAFFLFVAKQQQQKNAKTKEKIQFRRTHAQS